jgi:hypothetical protein
MDLEAECQAAARMLRSRADAEAVCNHVDPIPASTEALLARLRARWRWIPHYFVRWFSWESRGSNHQPRQTTRGVVFVAELFDLRQAHVVAHRHEDPRMLR